MEKEFLNQLNKIYEKYDHIVQRQNPSDKTLAKAFYNVMNELNNFKNFQKDQTLEVEKAKKESLESFTRRLVV